MVKPFRHQSELVARIRTRLRATNTDVAGLLNISNLTIDFTAHEVTKNGKVIALTRLEFDLLASLAREPGRVFSRDVLLTEVWGYRQITDTRLVNVHVQRLRAKIEDDPEHPQVIITVRGIGYKAGNQSK
jgi:two-component system response regulator MtrA